jgi:hypothetical protein
MKNPHKRIKKIGTETYTFTIESENNENILEDNSEINNQKIQTKSKSKINIVYIEYLTNRRKKYAMYSTEIKKTCIERVNFFIF